MKTGEAENNDCGDGVYRDLTLERARGTVPVKSVVSSEDRRQKKEAINTGASDS